jgi:hypothetical protein
MLRQELEDYLKIPLGKDLPEALKKIKERDITKETVEPGTIFENKQI